MHSQKINILRRLRGTWNFFLDFQVLDAFIDFFWKWESVRILKKYYPLLQRRDPIWNCRTKNSIISTSFWRKKNASSGGGGRRRSKQLNKRPRRSQAKKLVFQFLCFIKRFSVHIVTQLNSDNAIGRKVGKNTRAKNPISNIKVH